MKIGLLMGSFDPIHIGHLSMATNAINMGFVNKVIFVPTIQNPWKQNKPASFTDRCIMIQLAIEDIENFEISTIENLTTEPYYTSNTLKLLKERYPNDELFIIIGADTTIKDWHEGDWILNNFKIITVARPGYENIKIDIPICFDISSTFIRNLIKEHKTLEPFITKEVAQFINLFNIYNYNE